MLMCIIYLIFFTIIRGEDIFDKKRHNEVYYEDNIKDPVSSQYLSPPREVPTDPVYKYHESNKGHQTYHLLALRSPPKPEYAKLPLLIYENPLLMALLLSNSFSIPPIKYQGYNHPDQVSVNPYITLLLSQYGRYLPVHALGTKGLYYYAASNNYHNNKPFGSYKLNEETR